MAKIVRAISENGGVVAISINSKDIVSKAHEIHKTSATASAALGRFLTAGAMMGNMLKYKEESLTLRINGGGSAGNILVVSDYLGNVKGYMDNPIADLPSKAPGKLDVSGIVGKDGFLSVIKDLKLKEPYVGQVPIVSGEIAEDITSYYATSEQTPTVCALGVLVDTDLSIKSAGGYMIFLLPGASDEEITMLEENLKKLPAVSYMFEQGYTPEDICFTLLEGFNPEIIDITESAYKCDCSEQRVSKALISVGRKELESMIDDGKNVEINCHFCNKNYIFTVDDIKKLLS